MVNEDSKDVDMAVKNSQVVRESGRRTIKQFNYLWSWGYWFSSRTQGLLIHPYITMREINREHFLRPLVLLPVVVGLMSWVVAIVMGRVGLWFALETASWSVPVGRVLVFLWIWGIFFLILWQVVLGYLYLRFRSIE